MVAAIESLQIKNAKINQKAKGKEGMALGRFTGASDQGCRLGRLQ